MATFTYSSQTWHCLSFTIALFALLATFLTPTHAASLGSPATLKARHNQQQFTMRENAFTSLCPRFDTVRECCAPNDKVSYSVNGNAEFAQWWDTVQTQSQKDHDLAKSYEVSSASAISEAQSFARWYLGVNSRVQYYAVTDCQSCPDSSIDVPDGTKPFCCLPKGQFVSAWFFLLFGCLENNYGWRSYLYSLLSMDTPYATR